LSFQSFIELTNLSGESNFPLNNYKEP